MVSKTIDKSKKQYFLTQKGPILDMTRKTGYLFYTQTCCWGMGKVNYYCHLTLLLLGNWGEWTLTFNAFVMCNIGKWRKASPCSLWTYLDISSLYLCLFDPTPLVPVWKHCAPKWVRKMTVNEWKQCWVRKFSTNEDPKGFIPRRDWKPSQTYDPASARRCGWLGNSKKAELRMGDVYQYQSSPLSTGHQELFIFSSRHHSGPSLSCHACFP